MRIYFDHNATTPLDRSVVEVMTTVLQEDFGNASSVHYFGQRAKARLDDARSAVGGADRRRSRSEIVFTSGGTEADNFALRGAAEALEPTGRRHLIATSIEHEAVLVTLRHSPEEAGGRPCCRSTQTGIVDPEALSAALADDTAIVSVMHANNEIGTIQPIAELARRAHERGALFHTDAVQSVAKIPVDVQRAGRRSAVALGAQVQRAERRRGAVDQARHADRGDSDRREARANAARRHGERARRLPAWARRRSLPRAKLADRGRPAGARCAIGSRLAS